MIAIGEKLVIKPHRLLTMGVPFEQRECTVKSFDGVTICLYNENWSFKEWYGWFDKKDYYIMSHCNFELLTLLEQGDVQFLRFTGETVDGKVINIEIK